MEQAQHEARERQEQMQQQSVADAVLLGYAVPWPLSEVVGVSV